MQSCANFMMQYSNQIMRLFSISMNQIIQSSSVPKMSSSIWGSFSTRRLKFDKHGPKPPRIRRGKGTYPSRGLPSPYHDPLTAVALTRQKGILPLHNKTPLVVKSPSIERVTLENGERFFALNPKVRSILDTLSQRSNASTYEPLIQGAPTDNTLFLPPRTRPVDKRYANFRATLSDAEVADMARLRHSAPFTWSAAALAKKFDCSIAQVMDHCPLTPLAFTAKDNLADAQLLAAPLKYKKRKMWRLKLAEHRQAAYHQYNY
jgi:Mitochondrial ribosomal protein subunit L20